MDIEDVSVEQNSQHIHGYLERIAINLIHSDQPADLHISIYVLLIHKKKKRREIDVDHNIQP